jgi:PAS domain S-box-containing protein
MEDRLLLITKQILKNILIVEDEIVIAMAEASMLERYGFKAVIAGSGEAAVETVRSNPGIDLVLMDIHLGRGMDGIEAARAILTVRNIPIIFLSSHIEPEIVNRTEEVCSYGYVVKNSGETVLMTSIKMAFRLAEAWRRERENSEDLREREKRSQRREELLSSILRAAPTGIGFVVDRVFQEVNQTFCRMMGYSKEELIGSSARMIYPSDEEYERVGTEKYRQIAERGIGTIETTFRRKDGSLIDIQLSSTPINTIDLSKGVTFTAMDITEWKQTETRRRESEELFRAFMQHLPAYAFIKDSEGRYIFTNDGFRKIGGVNPETRIGKTDADLFPPEIADDLLRNDEKVRASGEPMEFIEKPPYGEPGLTQIHLVPKFPIRRVGRKDLIGGIAVDITARTEAEAALRQALEEKTALFRELQHRVKNSLLMISGLIGMELDRTGNEEIRSVLRDLKNRVMSIADLYTILYRLGAMDRIDLCGYLGGVVEGIRQAFLGTASEVRIVERYDHVMADMKSASTIGLILNELLTNALKYGFRERRLGVIEIRLSLGNEVLLLSVMNDGEGLPAGFDIRKTAGMGFRLISLLVEQIGGSFTRIPGNVTHFAVEIPWEDT